MTGFIRTEQVRILRETHYDVFQKVYKAARELREDLTVLHNLYADPEKKYVATFSVQDDLETFMKVMKEANRLAKETAGDYFTKYDDYLRTKGGQYILSKEMLAVMDHVSFAARKAEPRKN